MNGRFQYRCEYKKREEIEEMDKRYEYSCEDCLNAGKMYVTFNKFLANVHKNRCEYKKIKQREEIEEMNKKESIKDEYEIYERKINEIKDLISLYENMLFKRSRNKYVYEKIKEIIEKE